jgi:uncharacterized membrane protein (UPF0127 family)
MRSGWLLREGDVLCALEMTESRRERARGLRCRSIGDGAVHLPGGRAAHSLGMDAPMDAAFLSGDLVVLKIVHLRPWRYALRLRGARSVVEADGGALERWGVQVGDQLEIREIRPGS